MEVKCQLCDQKEEIDETTLLAKKLRNKPTIIYICDRCYNRITEKRLARLNEKNNNTLKD